jgi:uncharacterized protein (DUF1501 family)
VAALLKDLKQRGLLDATLVVWGAEFGRTPLAQGKPDAPNAGRDHHPFACSVWMAGGGVRGGKVIGKTALYPRMACHRARSFVKRT